MIPSCYKICLFRSDRAIYQNRTKTIILKVIYCQLNFSPFLHLLTLTKQVHMGSFQYLRALFIVWYFNFFNHLFYLKILISAMLFVRSWHTFKCKYNSNNSKYFKLLINHSIGIHNQCCIPMPKLFLLLDAVNCQSFTKSFIKFSTIVYLIIIH